MLVYKIPNYRTVEHLQDSDHVPSSSYSWNNSDVIYMYVMDFHRIESSLCYSYSSRTEILTSAECNNETIVHLTFHQRIFKLPDFVSACAYCQALPSPHSSPKFCKNLLPSVILRSVSFFLSHVELHFDFLTIEHAKNYMPVTINIPVDFDYRIIMILLACHLLFHYQNRN